MAARPVVPVAVAREGSKRSVVAAARVMVVQRRRWIRKGATWEGKKYDKRRNRLILVGNTPDAQVVP